MTYQHYEKLLGDTFFEANLKAESKFGKGNFEIITSKRVKHSIYYGFGHKEVVELTIGIIDSLSTPRSGLEAPSRPLPSVEVSTPRVTFSSLGGGEKTGIPPVKAPAIKAPALVDKTAIKSYINAQKLAPGMREVHGLRSNQEGNDEPQPQKLIEEPGLETDQIQEILAQVLAVKDERQRRDKIANTANLQPARTLAAAANIPTIAAAEPSSEVAKMARMVETLETRMNTLFSSLQHMNLESGKALEREIPDLPRGLFEVKKSLLAMETPAEVTDQLVFDLKDHLSLTALRMPDQAYKATASWLEQKLKFSSDLDLRRSNGPCIIVLIGPTGVGKTTTIAKLAAAYGLNSKDRKSVALFTLDTFRIGAAEQLQHYAQIIDVDMEILYKPEDIDNALPRHMDKDLIIVDTAGRCQKDTEELSELRTFIDRLPSPSRYLVLSATSKYVDMLDTVRCFGKVGFDHLIFTKIDETNSIGPLLAILVKTGKSLAYITNGQKVPEDFRLADFDFFNSRLFAANN